MSRHRYAALRAALPVALCAVIATQAGCHRRQFLIETVARSPDGRLWVAGTEGLAGAFGGSGFVRADYPCASRDHRSAYASYMDFPAAHIVEVAGDLFIFTRRVELLRWSGESWRPVALQVPIGEWDQLNDVIRAPDGRLLLNFGSDRILWTTPQDLSAGQFVAEPIPTYFTELGFVGAGVLYGLGYDNSGNVPVLRRRDGPGSWSVISRLPDDIHIDSFFEVVDAGGGVPAAVSYYGLHVPAGEQMELIPIAELLRRAGVQVEGDGAGSSGEASHVSAVVRMAGGAPLIQVSGRQPGLLGRLNGQDVFWACPDEHFVAGASGGDRVWVVTAYGAIYELANGQCRGLQAEVLERP